MVPVDVVGEGVDAVPLPNAAVRNSVTVGSGAAGGATSDKRGAGVPLRMTPSSIGPVPVTARRV